MESIATVRPDMAVLDKNKLMLSPFGALSHALAEEILARTGQAEGVYSFVPLELLNEPEAEPEAKAGEPTVNVEVKLTLELTQEARELRERTETVERILERIERIRERSEVAQKPMSRERDAAQPAESRSFFQNINQHISFPMTLSVPDTAGTAQPGGIARISEKFVNTLRTMREEGLYQEPGGETQRVADVGRGDAKIAGSEAAESGAASGEVGRAAVDRTVTSGRTDSSVADFAVRAAETELNTSGMNERSPETAARAAERIGEKIAESAAREIAEKFDELAKREAQAGGVAVTGRDGGASAATHNVDNERGQGVRDNDHGQGAHGDMETGRPSRTRRREAQNRENPEITEGADGEKPYAALTGTQDRAGEGTDGSGGTSLKSRREAAGIESEDRPARAVPVLNEDRPAAPEELTLAADARPERSGEETFRVGRETWEDTRRAHVKESRAKREHENEVAPRRAGKNRAWGEADEDTADTAGGTGTVEMAEGRTVAGETEKPGISQIAGEEEAASRSGHGREGVGTEAPEVAAVSREELTEEFSHRGRGGEVGELRTAEGEAVRAGTVEAGEAGRAGRAERAVEAIPERERPYMPVPEELTLSSGAERSGEESPTVGRQTTVDGGRAADRAKSTVEIDRKNLITHMTESAEVDTTAGEATVRGVDKAVGGTGSSKSAGDTVRTETVRETGPVREVGKTGELKTAERNAPKVGTAEVGEAGELRDAEGEAARAGAVEIGEAGRAERAVKAIPERERPYMPAPEELALRKEEAAAPEGEAQNEVEGRKVRGARDASESYDVREARNAREAHDVREAHDAVKGREDRKARDVVEGREIRKARDAVESYDTGVAEAIPLRGENEMPAPEELTLSSGAERSGEESPTVGRQAAVDGGWAADRAKSTVETDRKNLITHMTGAAEVDTTAGEATVRGADRAVRGTGSSESAGDTVRTETVRETGPVREAGKSRELKAAERNAPKVGTVEAGKTGELRDAEGEAARAGAVEAGEAGRAERAAEAIPERERPYMPAPEELALLKEEIAAPEGGAHNVGEAQNEIEGRKARGARDASESYDVREARDAGAARIAGEAHGVGRVRDAVEGREIRKARDTVESYDTGVAEAIPLRGEYAEVTPEELALARAEDAARPDGGRTGDTVRGAAAGEKRDTQPHGGETVHIDNKTGRPRRASAVIGEDGGEETGETGRTSETTGRAGKAGELRDAEGEAARARAAKVGEAGRAERAVEAIPDHEKPYVPVPEELALRKEETAAPEGGAILSPGSTAKSVEAFAEGIAEKARRAERAGIRAGDGNRSVASAGRSGPEAGIPRRGSAAGAGTVGFPPPVELIGATEGARDVGIAGAEAERGTRTERTAGGREYGDTTLRPGTVSADGTDNVAGREARRARRTAERASGGNAVAGPAPVELAYGGTGDARADERSRTQPAGNIAESEYVKSLPDWARRFLREGAGSLGTAGSMAVTSIPDTGKAQNKKPQMMEWTAPGYQPTPPAETQFKELRPPEDTGGQTGEVHISDAEIRRTADRVYKMIEDRIRRERRRLGL